MNNCSVCGLPTTKSHKIHDDIKTCLGVARDALEKLAIYRLLEGNEEEMTENLRQETLEIAMKIHRNEVHAAVKKSNLVEEPKPVDLTVEQHSPSTVRRGREL
jgi:hypothetical protein